MRAGDGKSEGQRKERFGGSKRMNNHQKAKGDAGKNEEQHGDSSFHALRRGADTKSHQSLLVGCSETAL